MSPTTRVAVESFWQYVAFALNAVVFLLIGFQVRIDELAASWRSILVAYVAVMVARAVVVVVVTAVLRRTRERVPWRWSAVMTWGGLRGALSMVLVLALPAEFPYRHTLVTMTFGVVLMSLLLQGMTMGPLLRKLGIVSNSADRDAYERLRGRRRAAAVALQALMEMVRGARVHDQVAARLRVRYEQTVASADAAIADLHLETSVLLDEERLAVGRALLAVDKDAVLEELRQGLVSTVAAEHLMRELDARFSHLDTDSTTPNDSAEIMAQAQNVRPPKGA